MPRIARALASLLLLAYAASGPAVAPAPPPGTPAGDGVAVTLHSDPVADLPLQRVERREL